MQSQGHSDQEPHWEKKNCQVILLSLVCTSLSLEWWNFKSLKTFKRNHSQGNSSQSEQQWIIKFKVHPVVPKQSLNIAYRLVSCLKIYFINGWHVALIMSMKWATWLLKLIEGIYFGDHYNCQNCEKRKGQKVLANFEVNFQTTVNLNPLSGVPRLFCVPKVQWILCSKTSSSLLCNVALFLEIHWLKQKELSFEMRTWSELWWAWAISGIWWIAIFPGGKGKCGRIWLQSTSQ